MTEADKPVGRPLSTRHIWSLWLMNWKPKTNSTRVIKKLAKEALAAQKVRILRARQVMKWVLSTLGYKFEMSKVARHVLSVTRSSESKSKISTLDCTTYDREVAAGFKVSTKKAAAGASQDLPKLRMGLPTTGSLCSLIRILNVPALFAPRSCKRKSTCCLQTIPE